jgi:hypothetical protein
MPVSIELFFDSVTSNAIESCWKDLTGITGSEYMVKNGVHSHVALTIVEAMPSELHSKMKKFAMEFSSFPLIPSGIDSFKADSAVVYVGFERVGLLEKIHQDVYKLVQEFGLKPDDYYTPEKWIPHCTLAMEFPLIKEKNAVESVKVEVLKLPYRVEALGVIKYPPTELISEYKLRDSSHRSE